MTNFAADEITFQLLFIKGKSFINYKNALFSLKINKRSSYDELRKNICICIKKLK